MNETTREKYLSVVSKAQETGWGAVRLARETGITQSTVTHALQWGIAQGMLAARPQGSNLPSESPNLGAASKAEVREAKPPAPAAKPKDDRFGDFADLLSDSPDDFSEDGLPDADSDAVEPFVFDGNGQGLLLCDAHLPYHDKSTLALAVRDGRKRGANHIILDGDIIDFYQISKFCTSGKAKSVAEEIRVCRQFLAWLRSAFPKARIVYKKGNHELRMEHYLQTGARELEDLDDLELPRLLRFADHGIEMVEEHQFIYYGHLTILHGHEFRRTFFNPVNPARGAFLRAMACTLVAHHHQSSMHTAQNIRGVLTSCWSVGCSCTLRPKYSPANNWNLGFAALEKDGNSFTVANKHLADGEVY